MGVYIYTYIYALITFFFVLVALPTQRYKKKLFKN